MTEERALPPLPPSEREDLVIERLAEGRILLMRMSRPQAMNALSRSLIAQMRAEIAALPAGPAKVLVLAGSGRAFCAGADLKERAGLAEAEKRLHNREINALANELAACPLPTIAMLNGLALGGGCEIALACDLRLAADGIQIGLTEARLGAMPGAGGSQRLPRLIGAARALELMFGGNPIEAGRALDWGLVNAVHPPERLEAETLAMAQLFASRARRTAALLKRCVYDGLQTTLEAGLEFERAAVFEILGSADYQEGLAAFAARRPPEFD